MGRTERGLQGELVGVSAAFVELCALLDELAPTDDRVLIVGETGTGKGLAARRLHDHGPRRNGPFVKVNCAGLPEPLLESELFGHEAGAFTGALRTHHGCFERAHGGTLFLDEIGDMAPAAQTRLLGVVEDGVVTRLGGETPIDVDVRVVSATNQDPKALLAAGGLREDLYWRLAQVLVRISPLRDRPEDIAPIANHLLRRIAAKRAGQPPALTAGALARLAREPWLGNVRELEARLLDAWRRGRCGERIEATHVEPQRVVTAMARTGHLALPRQQAAVEPESFPPADWRPRMPDSPRKRAIMDEAMARAGPDRGRLTRAAAVLRVAPDSLRRMRHRLAPAHAEPSRDGTPVPLSSHR